MPIAISKDIRDQVLARVREGKDTVVEIARQHGLKINTVYGWLSRSVAGPGSSLLQVARLKKQNRSLKQIIGNLMLEMESGKKIAMIRTAVNKTELAKELGISRSSLYYQPKRPAVDEEVRRQIESVLSDHPAYGHKRIALALKLNKKRIRRVMKKFGLKPYRRKARRPKKIDDMGKPPTRYQNLIEDLKVDRPGRVWVTDFTYVRFHGRFVYLATVMDLFTREVVGFNLSRFHNRFLVMGAVLDALEHCSPPEIIHSDQGSEYDSQDFIDLINSLNIEISMSRKASPWENGYQESFFGHLKQEGGDLNRFETDGELLEELYRMIYYYNYQRIHSKLKMPPAKFRQQYILRQGGDIKSMP